MNGLDVLSHYKLYPAKSGNPTVLQTQHNIILHSRINPIKEAEDIARSFQLDKSDFTLLIGGGLGYLPEAMHRVTNEIVRVVELEQDLFCLAKTARASSDYINSDRILIYGASEIQNICKILTESNEKTKCFVAPYLYNTTILTNHKLSGLIQLIRSNIASLKTYAKLFAENNRTDSLMTDLDYDCSDLEYSSDKITIVCGAGPSLNDALSILNQHRNEIQVIATSGAVPALIAANVHPDWVIALEAKSLIAKDLSVLRAKTRIITFDSTNDLAYHVPYAKYYRSGQGNLCLETWGGSSVIPALDLALKKSNNKIILVGIDLSNENGSYALNTIRDNSTDQINPPKFAAMRYGLERLIEKYKHTLLNESIYQISNNTKHLRDTKPLSINSFSALLSSKLKYTNAHY